MEASSDLFAKQLAAPFVPKLVLVQRIPVYPPPSIAAPKRRSVRHVKFIYYAALAILLPLTLVASLQLLRVSRAGLQAAQAQSLHGVNGDNPSEEAVGPAAIADYKVAADGPRLLTIPAIGVEARIMRTNLTDKGAIDAPWNINDTGWYRGSALPSAGDGVSLVLGHLSGKTSVGIFKNLHKLQVGGDIVIENGNGSTIPYDVVKQETKSADSIIMASILKTNSAYDLVLLTCAGTYNKDTQGYSDRTIVYAKRQR